MNKIDILKMVRKIRDNHYEATKNMNMQSKLEYYKNKSQKLRTSEKAGNLT